jgi:CHRD domain
MTMKTSILVCFGAAALFACSSDNNADAPITSDAPVTGSDARPADAGAAKVFTVTLTHAGEPSCTPGANATGSATVTISADGSQIMVSATYSGLSGTASHAHLHFGGASAEAAGTGPVVLDFGTGSSIASPISKTFTASDYQAASGAPATFAAYVAAARGGGMAYMNIHTSACPGGEIGAVLQ